MLSRIINTIGRGVLAATGEIWSDKCGAPVVLHTYLFCNARFLPVDLAHIVQVAAPLHVKCTDLLRQISLAIASTRLFLALSIYSRVADPSLLIFRIALVSFVALGIYKTVSIKQIVLFCPFLFSFYFAINSSQFYFNYKLLATYLIN